jgi:hypothetical protein
MPSPVWGRNPVCDALGVFKPFTPHFMNTLHEPSFGKTCTNKRIFNWFFSLRTLVSSRFIKELMWLFVYGCLDINKQRK